MRRRRRGCVGSGRGAAGLALTRARPHRQKATWKFSYDRTANPGDKHPVLSRDDVLRGEAAATVPTTRATWAEEPDMGDAAARGGERGSSAPDGRASEADSLPGGAALGSTGRWSSSFRDWINTLRSEEAGVEERPEALELDFWAGSEGGDDRGEASPEPGTPPPLAPSPSPMRAGGATQGAADADGWVDDDSEDELPEEPWYHQVAATFSRQRAPIRPLRPVPFYTTTKELLVIVSQVRAAARVGVGDPRRGRPYSVPWARRRWNLGGKCGRVGARPAAWTRTTWGTRTRTRWRCCRRCTSASCR